MRHKQNMPNILLIIMDTARVQNMSCYGYKRDTTPCINKLASEGILFENAISAAPWTLPSYASIFTGLFPSRHGAHARHKYLSQQCKTLPTLLKKRGYCTIGISSNPWFCSHFGLDQGLDQMIYTWKMFQTHSDLAKIGKTYPGLKKFAKLWRIIRNEDMSKNLANEFYRFYLKIFASRCDSGARRINNEIKRWIAHHRDQDRPFCMVVSYMEPHGPYDPPKSYKKLFLPKDVKPVELKELPFDPYAYILNLIDMTPRQSDILRGLYDGELCYLDSKIGAICNYLQQQGILDETILVILSDHGENIGEHHMRSHMYCLYDTLIRVPLILRYPKELQADQRINTLVQTVDILPTILDLSGIGDKEVFERIQGQSLFTEKGRESTISEYMWPEPSIETLRNRYPEASEDDLSRLNRSLRCIRTKEYKLIKSSDSNHELYNLKSDPNEIHNLISSQSEVAADLMKRLEKWENQFISEHEYDHVSIPEDIKKNLKALGYF